MVDISSYVVGKVIGIQDVGRSGGGGKALRACDVDIGGEKTINVVTSAPNVREGSRLVVAPVGSVVLDDEGEEMEIKKISVGGVMSEGMFCDSQMLGWSGGGKGVAAQVPESLALGSPPPASKPGRPVDDNKEPPADSGKYEGLFEKKLTKEEKKKLAEERKKARKAKKAAAKAAE